MKFVYIAGPFTASSRSGIEENIRAAERLALKVARLGAFPVCPHTNSGHPEFVVVQPYEFWLEGTLRLMRLCDAAIFSERWFSSRGARGEHVDALTRGQPVFYESNIEALAKWLASSAHNAA